ncbi:MAG TPA: hypothetical protein VGR62_00210, partial [Candidatus Binatia bacterium]|nr:hypothetical protein [Candidatus Binatia bacterium]
MRIEHAATPDPVDVATVRGRLDQWNVAVTGRGEWWEVAIFLRDDADTIRGGLLGGVWADWLHVSILWVDEPLR